MTPWQQKLIQDVMTTVKQVREQRGPKGEPEGMLFTYRQYQDLISGLTTLALTSQDLKRGARGEDHPRDPNRQRV